MTLLAIDGLTVRTASGTVLVDGVDMRLDAGERVGLIGESGCGKSLTALSVMGLLSEGLTASGRVDLDGTDVVSLGESEQATRRGEVAAMVFQEPMSALNPLMRVGAQVAEAVRLHRHISRRDSWSRAVDLLAQVEIPDAPSTARAYPFQLSGGQRQRVVLAIALARHPRLLICDEPTTALDVTVQARMLALIDRLVRDHGSALLFITHDLAVMASLCDRVIVMYGGRIVESGAVPDVLEDPRHPYTAGLLVASAATAVHTRGTRLPTIPGSVPSAGAFPSGCVFRNRCVRADEACLAVPALIGHGHAAACFHPLDVSGDAT